MKKIIVIIGARPQFIKHFPFQKAAAGKLNLVTIHTGQHYDNNMSAVFFDQLGMPKPDYTLQLGGGNHGSQTGNMMIAIENIVLDEKPDGIVVYGDTNSTLAGALVSSKLHIPLVHIEAGLRSYNKEMPEEINRVLTDHISNLLLVPSKEAQNNLLKEGIKDNVYEVGDIMKDLVSLCINQQLIKQPTEADGCYFVTLHRPYNTDNKERLSYVLQILNTLDKPIVFAIHPRTRNAMSKYSMKEQDYENIKFIDPQSYFENLGYLAYSDGLITDSGGMQKEAYWLGKKCVTIRTETEWVETLTDGANTLMFDDLTKIQTTLSDKKINFNKELYGNGNTAQQMIELIINLFNPNE